MGEHWFIGKHGDRFKVVPLTFEMAALHAAALIDIHNTIPFQEWSMTDLLADGDETRRFIGKWQISTLSIGLEGELLGFCIGFYRDADGGFCTQSGLYIHRLAVSSKWHRNHIGAIMLAETIHGRDRIGGQMPAWDRVFVQTPSNAENEGVVKFYQDAGFRITGTKDYGSRWDYILEVTKQELAGARQNDIWKMSKLGCGEA